jgi:hypothetical protein
MVRVLRFSVGSLVNASRDVSSSSGRIRSTLKLLALVILLSGLGSAASIWLAQDRVDQQTRAADTTGPLSPEDSRRYTHDVQLYYGETGLLMDKWKRWLKETGRGKGFATALAVASLVVASGVFFVAHRKATSGAVPQCINESLRGQGHRRSASQAVIELVIHRLHIGRKNGKPKTLAGAWSDEWRSDQFRSLVPSIGCGSAA